MTDGRVLLPLALAVGILGSATLAAAADGVVEINQEKALAGGVTPGDAPGFPVTLSLPGKYQLTSDLVASGRDTLALAIEADGMTIDLGGFRLAGPQLIRGESRSRITLQDGIVGPCLQGIGLGAQARIWNVVKVDFCRLNGVGLGSWSIVGNSDLGGGDGSGLRIGEGVLHASTISGFSMTSMGVGRSVVVDSEAEGGALGLGAIGSVVRNTRVAGSFHGVAPAYVQVRDATVIERCAVSWTGRDPVAAISASEGSSVSSSIIGTIHLDGLLLDSDSAYRDDTITTAGFPGVTGGVDLGGNSCNGEPCP
jgi:hypothetical protein